MVTYASDKKHTHEVTHRRGIHKNSCTGNIIHGGAPHMEWTTGTPF